MFVIGGLSAFINNTAAVAIFIKVWHTSTTLSQPSTKNHPKLIPSDCLTH
jgi:hypothetical protein